MPLTTDEKLLALSREVIDGFDAANGGIHAGFRPAHAKGILLKGKFRASAAARQFTRAPHVLRESVPVTVRLSDFAGIPSVPDNSSNASPRGCAIRFHLAEHSHTDIVAHSVDAFPTRTAEEFLEFLHALLATNPEAAHPNALERFLGAHPAALAFVQTPKPIPVSFGREQFFAVSAFRFTNEKGESCHGRYRILPWEGTEYMDETTAAELGDDFLFDEIAQRVAKEAVRFTVSVQIAGEGDVVDDATVRWPESRRLREFGEITLTAIAGANASEQRQIIFDPIPRVEGIEASADPLFDARANIYLMTGRRRRAAGGATGAHSGA
jgi:catalase